MLRALSVPPASITFLDTTGSPRRFAAYLRVSTESQGRSGLSLEAQHQAVAAHLAYAGGELVAEFQEVESGRTSDRPQLPAALACCRTRRAVLLVAKLEAGLTGQRTRAALAAAKARGIKLGNPRPRPGTADIAAGARAAKAERARVKTAELRAVVEALRTEGAVPQEAGLRTVAAALEMRGVRAPRGGTAWSAAQVRRVLIG